jgi:hypothetical protein
MTPVTSVDPARLNTDQNQPLDTKRLRSAFAEVRRAGQSGAMATSGPPALTVAQGDEVARNELGERGWYHTKVELRVLGKVAASKIEVVVFGPIRHVVLRHADGGTAHCAGGSGPDSAGCTLQNPPTDGHVVVDIASDSPLEGSVRLEARAW